MAAIFKSLLLSLYSVRIEASQNVEQVPTTVGGEKTVVHTELEKLSKRLFTSKVKSLKLVHSQLLNGMIAVKRGEEQYAIDFFRSATQFAFDSFIASTSFADRVLSTRMRIISLLALYTCSLGDYKSKEFTQAEVSSVINDLVKLQEVQKAMKSSISPAESVFQCPCSSGALKTKSGRILMEVSSVVHFSEEALQFAYKIPAATLRSSSKSNINQVQDCSDSEKTAELSLASVKSKLRGHRNRVTCFATSSEYLFSGSKDSHIRVWDIKTLALRATLRGHKNAVSCLVVSGGELLSGSGDGSVRRWDIPTLTQLACSSIPSDFTVRSLAVDVTSHSVYAGCNDGVIRMLDLTSLAVKGSVRGHNAWVSSLAVSGDRLFSGSVDCSIAVWDAASLMCVHRMHGHASYITSLVVAGGRLFSGSSDATVRVWDLRDYAEVAVIGPTTTALPISEQDCSVRSLAATSTKLFIGCANDHIRVVSLTSLQEVSSVKAQSTSFDDCLAVADGKMFVGSRGKTIHVHLL